MFRADQWPSGAFRELCLRLHALRELQEQESAQAGEVTMQLVVELSRLDIFPDVALAAMRELVASEPTRPRLQILAALLKRSGRTEEAKLTEERFQGLPPTETEERVTKLLSVVEQSQKPWGDHSPTEKRAAFEDAGLIRSPKKDPGREQ